MTEQEAICHFLETDAYKRAIERISVAYHYAIEAGERMSLCRQDSEKHGNPIAAEYAYVQQVERLEKARAALRDFRYDEKAGRVISPNWRKFF